MQNLRFYSQDYWQLFSFSPLFFGGPNAVSKGMINASEFDFGRAQLNAI